MPRCSCARLSEMALAILLMLLAVSLSALFVHGAPAAAAAAAAASPASAACPLPKSAHTLMKFDLSAQKARIQIDTVPATLKVLEELKGSITIVSIAGMYRTGKSFLLNQLLPKGVPANVFSVGHTVQPHT